MTDAEIGEALDENLPDGWSCVQCADEKYVFAVPCAGLHQADRIFRVSLCRAVYYWNETTDQVTWLHPVEAAHSQVPNARASFQETLDAVESGEWRPAPETVEM